MYLSLRKTFVTSRKRYSRAEKEFIESKIDLHKKSDFKDNLTEHLYTVIHQNELRKATKLAELMKKLEMECGADDILPEGFGSEVPGIPLCLISPLEMRRPHGPSLLSPMIPPTENPMPVPEFHPGGGEQKAQVTSEDRPNGGVGVPASVTDVKVDCGDINAVRGLAKDFNRNETSDVAGTASIDAPILPSDKQQVKS